MDGFLAAPPQLPFCFFLPEGWLQGVDTPDWMLFAGVSPDNSGEFPPNIIVHTSKTLEDGVNTNLESFLLGEALGLEAAGAKNVESGIEIAESEIPVGWIAHEMDDDVGTYNATLLLIMNEVGYLISYKSPKSMGLDERDAILDSASLIELNIYK